MPKIRHEINLINGSLTSIANEKSWFDPAQFSGTITTFFEVLAACSSGSATVLLTTGGVNWATATISSPAYTLVRVTTTINTSGLYYVSAGTNITVRSARLIVIQDTGASNLTKCETQIEIGSRTSVIATVFPTGAGASNMTYPKYWFYDATKWDGTVSIYFDVTMLAGQSKTNSSVVLQMADGTGDGFTGWANVAGSTLSTVNLQNARFRSGALTLTSGRWYRMVGLTGSSKSALLIYSAKIVVQQAGNPPISSSLISQPVGGSSVGLQGDGGEPSVIAQGFTTGASPITVTSIVVSTISGINSPTDELFMEIVNIYGGTVVATSTINSTKNSSFYFLPAVNLSANTLYYFQIKRTIGYDSSFYLLTGSTTDVYAGGAHWRLQGSGWVQYVASDMVFNVMGYVTSSDTGIAKLHPQYLISNTLLATGTAIQKFLTAWDSTEWSGVANTYSFQANAANGSVSAVQLRTADDATLVATVTSPDNAGTGVATMPASTNLDVKATTNNNDIYATRITVDVVISAGPASSIKAVETVPYASIGKISGLALASIGKVSGLA